MKGSTLLQGGRREPRGVRESKTQMNLENRDNGQGREHQNRESAESRGGSRVLARSSCRKSSGFDTDGAGRGRGEAVLVGYDVVDRIGRGG